MRSLFPKLCIAALLLLAGQVTHTEAQCKQSVYVCDIYCSVGQRTLKCSTRLTVTLYYTASTQQHTNIQTCV